MNPGHWFRNWFAPPGGAASCDSESIRKWIDTRTFHHSQFSDLQRLVRSKQEQNISISLCLPTLNEERTIGKEIVLLKAELMDRHPLLDEITVIDSGSTDRTRDIAAGFGANVYLASDILPEEGVKRGKGENLWKALYQMKGDIIIYIDADITNIRPHFAYGLVGPLLQDPALKYVKAFYERPLTLASGTRVSGGGRVTEILVRPLFSMFFPELTAFVQPLSGEYAARREALERIPFPVGYGVETSHLLDIYNLGGMDAFAQVDLDQRIHRNQSTHALGKMSFGILQTFFSRLKEIEKCPDFPAWSQVLRQHQCQDNVYEQVEIPVVEEDRPPILSLQSYRQKFGRA